MNPPLRHPHRSSSILVFVGSIGAIVSMVLHPIPGHEGIDEHMAAVSAGVHGVAIASLWVQFAGLLGVHRCLRETPGRADLGLVAIGVGYLFASLAATVNGIGVPALVELRDGLAGAERTDIQATWRVMHRMGDVMTQVFFAGSLLCLASWSWALVGKAALTVGLGFAATVAGCYALMTGALEAEVVPLLIFVAGFQLWAMSLAIWMRGAPAIGSQSLSE